MEARTNDDHGEEEDEHADERRRKRGQPQHASREDAHQRVEHEKHRHAWHAREKIVDLRDEIHAARRWETDRRRGAV